MKDIETNVDFQEIKAKAYNELRQPVEIWKKIQHKREQLERINESAVSMSQTIHVDGIRTQGTGKSKVEESVIKAETVREELLDLVSEYSDAQDAIDNRLKRHAADFTTDERMFIEVGFYYHKTWTYKPGRGDRSANDIRSQALRKYMHAVAADLGQAEGDGETIATDIVIECPK